MSHKKLLALTSWFPRRRPGVTFLIFFNLPWLIAWFILTRPGADRGLAIPALHLLLVILTVGLVILPLLLLRELRNRWLLTTPLAVVNLFWALRWISAFSKAPPYSHSYGQLRLVYIALMLFSSLVVISIYRMTDSTRDRSKP